MIDALIQEINENELKDINSDSQTQEQLQLCKKLKKKIVTDQRLGKFDKAKYYSQLKAQYMLDLKLSQFYHQEEHKDNYLIVETRMGHIQQELNELDQKAMI